VTADQLGFEDESERWARAALVALAEPGDRPLHDLVERLGGVDALAALRSGRGAGGGSGTERYRARIGLADPDAIRSQTIRAGARVVVPGDAEWGAGLDLLRGLTSAASAPPLALWVRGRHRLDDGESSVAVVGARAATTYGCDVAASIAYELAERGVVVVSGAAYGIDGAAHRAALAAGGTTVAVLASGVDRAYPVGHDALLERITERGAVVSEALPGQHPSRSRFLTRNRLIAAMSAGVVVVEAALRSGALNTAHWATQLSRHVMAVPGPVTSAMSAGPHRAVIDRGAALVTDAADVLELVSPVGNGTQTMRRGEERARDHLPADALAVLEALPARAARDAGQLAVAAGVALDAAIGALGLLAADGWVERAAVGWRRLPRRG
jgi:DNA processing protein